MTSNNYINKIIESNTCSIATAENLTRALHREEKLNKDLMVRFRPLDGGLDIIPVRWYNSLATNTPCECDYHKEITNITCMDTYLADVKKEYRPNT